MSERFSLYVNGQDIAGLVLGTLNPAGEWIIKPEHLPLSPEKYLAGLEDFLNRHKFDKSQIENFVLVQGPGSATALRVSHALVNSLAFALGLQVISVSKALEQPDGDQTFKLSTLKTHVFATPVYSRAPNITATKRDSLRRKT